ncbi:mannan endo-1,4-beta-mannosidase [Clostridia bacterium]|nr:mannan endo-1,4-beta-mannosidase [Clostridia bacterium]
MRKYIKATISLLLAFAVLFGCTPESVPKIADAPEKPPAPIDDTPVTYEAEDWVLLGNAKILRDLEGYSGKGYVGGFAADGDACVITIDVPRDGFYNLTFTTASDNGEYKQEYVYIDKTQVGAVTTDSTEFDDDTVYKQYLTAGKHELEYAKFWGWDFFDKLTVTQTTPISPDVYKVSAELVTPSPSASAQELMSYLAENYGKKILTGQYSELGMNGFENYVIRDITGKQPAILGLDLMDYSPSRKAHGVKSGTVEKAIEFSEAGGIVTICWHWSPPAKFITGDWATSFYAEQTDIDLPTILLEPDGDDYKLLMSDMDEIAKELVKLRDANVPVLWRPLHEGAGKWFWWGAYGGKAYKELYDIMYEKFTKEYGLNNLIWVWNGESADYYPGDDKVDIVATDIYTSERNYSSQINAFTKATMYADKPKIIALSENGAIPDPELSLRDNAMWSFFVTWKDDFVLIGREISKYSEKYTEQSMLEKAYNSDITITLDELPKK